ncbi:BYPASS-related protein [Tanacetum coccineum]
MPPTDNQGSFLNRISIRRNQVVYEQEVEDLEQFQKHVADLLSELFHLPEYRTVKALDICTAITHGIDLLLHWEKLAQTAVDSLQKKSIGDGDVKRPKKALNTFAENHHHSTKSGASSKDHTTIGNLRSLSYWSASKLIQAMSSNLTAPRGGKPTGLVVPVYLTSSVLVFMMWAMVSAIPCQERTGLGAHLQLSKQFTWGQPMIGLQEKIGEDWKKKEKKGTSGMLDETQRLEKLGLSLVEFADGFSFPVEAEKAEEVAAMVAEMAEICGRMDEGLGALQMQVRELFNRIVRSRAETLDVLNQVNKVTTPVPY